MEQKEQKEQKVVKEITTKIVKIKNTPFSLVVEELKSLKRVKIVSGKYLCSNIMFPNVTEAKKYINKKPWELITAMCIILKKELKDE